MLSVLKTELSTMARYFQGGESKCINLPFWVSLFFRKNKLRHLKESTSFSVERNSSLGNMLPFFKVLMNLFS